MDWSQPPLRLEGCKVQTSLASKQRLDAANEYKEQHKTNARAPSDSERQAKGKPDVRIGAIAKAVVR